MALIRVDRERAVAVVTLNDPDRRNALSPEMRAELLAALDPLMADGECRSVVLTGAGGTFCAGGDLRSMRSGDPIYARHRMMVSHRLVRLLAAGPKPVVAAVEGFAFGAGLSLAALADTCVASREASFGAVFGRVGLMADLGLLWSLPQRIGAARARRLMLEAGTLDAAEAGRLGLADVLVEPGGALEAALDVAHAFEDRAPLPIAATRSALAQLGGDLDRALALEADLQSALMASADHEEGRTAFLEKRRPTFRGS